MKLNTVKSEVANREATQSKRDVFKPTKAETRVRLVPVREDKPFYELSSIELNGTYYTLPFRKTKRNESKDPNNYYTNLIQPVYGADSALYSKIKQREKYIFCIIEFSDDGLIVAGDEGIIKTWYPSPGLGNTLIDEMMDLEDGLEPFEANGVDFIIKKGTDKRTGFPDYSKSHFANKNTKVEEYDAACKEAWALAEPTTSNREDVELALRNFLGGRVILNYSTIDGGKVKTSPLEKSEEGDAEEMDEFEKKLMTEIESI